MAVTWYPNVLNKHLISDFDLSEILLLQMYGKNSILAVMPIPDTIKTPLIMICGRPWWIWCDHVDDIKPVTFQWVEDTHG